MTRMSAADKEMVASGMESVLINKSARAEAEKERLLKKQKEEDAIQNINGEISRGKLSGQAHITVNRRQIKITLNPDVFFASGSESINLNTQHALESLIKLLREFPNDIIIEGHTDNVPMHSALYSSNWELSVARAVSVINFFIEKGLNPRQLVAAGYGEYHPAFPNDTAENRSKNRRIEITIFRQPGGAQ